MTTGPKIIHIEARGVTYSLRVNWEWLARSFLSSASVLNNSVSYGSHASISMLLGQAAELIAKLELLDRVATEAELKKQNYRHHVGKMWKCDTNLYEFSNTVSAKLISEGILPSRFVFSDHFEMLSTGHDAPYGYRYGNKDWFPDTESLCRVFFETLKHVERHSVAGDL